MHCKNSMLFGDESTWTKKNDSLFDVTMGSYDGAEMCQLVGLYLLHKLNKNIKNQHLGLYRDDGLAIINSKSGPIIERIKKNILTIFQNNSPEITTESNLLQNDFLDITLNLITGKYWPYRKPGDIPLYINAKSNHPPNIKKTINQNDLITLIKKLSNFYFDNFALIFQSLSTVKSELPALYLIYIYIYIYMLLKIIESCLSP